MATATHPFVRLWRVCDAAELLLRFFVAIRAAELDGRLSDDTARLAATRIDHPTLGAWLELAVALAAESPANPLVPELPAALRETVYPLITGHAPGVEERADYTQALLPLRNVLAHGAGFPDLVAEELVMAHASRLLDALGGMPWLADLLLIAPARKGGWLRLTGATPSERCEPADLGLAPGALSEQEGGVYVVRQARAVHLWPLHAFEEPRLKRPKKGDERADRPAPLIYSRREGKRLQHTALGSRMPVGELRGEAVTRFDRLFRLAERKALLGLERSDFRAEFREEAERLSGRTEQVAAILEAFGGPDRVLWLHGGPGMGKSAIMAAVANRLVGTPRRLVVEYRLRAADPRANRLAFLKHAIKRIESWDAGIPAIPLGDRLEVLEDRLREVLAALPPNRDVAFILDGLDEIAGIDRAFVDLPFRISSPGTTWLCAARPIAELKAVFKPDRCRVLFGDNGLPGMSAAEIGAWLKRDAPSRIGEHILAQENEGSSPWVEAVAERSEGSPAYLVLLLADLWSDEISVGDEPPRGLEAYFVGLLKGWVDIDTSVILMAIALAAEAPDARLLAEVLKQSGDLQDDGEDTHEAAVEEALGRARALVVVVETAAGECYLPYHQSLGDHLRTTPTLVNKRGRIGKAWAALAANPGTLADPGLRRRLFSVGVRQLLELGRAQAARDLLSNQAYVVARMAGATGEEVTALRREILRDASLLLAPEPAGEATLRILEVATGQELRPASQVHEAATIADEAAAWLVPPLAGAAELHPLVVELLASWGTAPDPVRRRVAQEVAGRNTALLADRLGDILAAVGRQERPRMLSLLVHGHRDPASALAALQRLIGTAHPSRLHLLLRRRRARWALDFSIRAALDAPQDGPTARTIFRFWLDLTRIGRPGGAVARILAPSLGALALDGYLKARSAADERVPGSARQLLADLRAAAPDVVALLGHLQEPASDDLGHLADAALAHATARFSAGRGLLYALLLLQGVWSIDRTGPLLDALTRRGGEQGRMAVHAVLLRIFQQLPAGREAERRAVADRIFALARAESEEDYFYRDAVGVDTKHSVYHPLAPAGTACAELGPGRPLAFFAEFIAGSPQLPEAERERRLRRAARDLLWVGIYYPREAFLTMPLLADEPLAQDELFRTLAYLAVVHGPDAEAFYARHLAGRIEWPDLLRLVDHEWLDRYMVERGAGRLVGAILLARKDLRVALVDLVRAALAPRATPTRVLGTGVSRLLTLLGS